MENQNTNTPPSPAQGPNNEGNPTPQNTPTPPSQAGDLLAKSLGGSSETKAAAVQNPSVPPQEKVVAETPLPEKAPAPAESSSGGGMGILKIFLWAGGILAFLFYALLLWSLFKGSVDNPLFELLGISATNLKATLIQFTNGLFGILCLILLLVALVNLFRFALTPKEYPIRKDYGRKATFWGVSFLVLSSVFIVMYILIARASTDVRSDIDQSMILTEPSRVVGLQAPVTVHFDLETKLEQLLGGDLNLVRRVAWDFDGDGATDATELKVSHRFVDKGTQDGRFIVKATGTYFSNVTGQEEAFETNREVVISDVGVSAEITANVDQGVSPLKIEFSAGASEDPDGQIVRYEWDFDDDGVFEITQQEPGIIEHSFSQIGEHIVRLRVTGSNNDFAVTEKTIKVEGGRPSIEAKITGDRSFVGEAPLQVEFSGRNSYVESGVITQYEWFFQGEKSAVLGSTQRRTYRDPGTYTVALTVENDLGERHREEIIITVLDELQEKQAIITTEPVTGDGGILYGRVPFSVSFDASTSTLKSPVDWAWDFDADEETDAFGEQSSHVFREPGQYLVGVTVTDLKGQTHQGIQRVVVQRSGLTADIQADQLSGAMPLSILFDGSGSISDNGEIIDYIWEFPGQDPLHYSAQISYLFRQVGTFPVKLTVINADGEQASHQVFVSVRPPALIAEFNMLPDSGAAPLEVAFDPTPSQGVAQEYYWDFGDGTKVKQFNPRHTYKEPGTYTVELRIVNKHGIVSAVEKKVVVTGEDTKK